MKSNKKYTAEFSLQRRNFLKIPATFCGLALIPACGGGSSKGNKPAPTVQTAVFPEIVEHPASTEVLEGDSASFLVTATGTAPLGYQWKRNGQDIPSANERNLILPEVTLGENGDVFTVTISNAAGTLTSVPAQLTVVRKTTTIDSTILSIDSTQVTADIT